MTTLAWLLGIGVIAGLAFWLWRVQQSWQARKQASEARYADFVVSAHIPPSPKATAPVPAPGPMPQLDPAALGVQKLLLEAASKAASAGEPALSIQLYARLLSRYPDTAYAAQARSAVQELKKKFAPR